MKIRIVMAAKGTVPLPRDVRGARHAPNVRAPLALLLCLSASACVAPTTTVTKTETVVTRPSADPSPTAQRHVATVTRVVDGDTAHVSHRGRDVTIRFIGVDTPETVAPGQSIECYGPESSAFTTRQLTGTRIRLEFDVDRIDPYGRTLAYLWMRDGSMFNETLVRDGYAKVATYPPDTKYVQRFQAAQHDAQDANRGLWGAC
jgi:micrococcal nuclease